MTPALDGIERHIKDLGSPDNATQLEAENELMAAAALSEIPSHASVDLLAKLLRDEDPGIRQWAVESLWQVGEAEPETLGATCLRLVESLLDHPDEKTRRHAASWSARLRDALETSVPGQRAGEKG